MNALLRQQGLGAVNAATTGGGRPEGEFSIATWNVNSLRVRGEQLHRWLRTCSPTWWHCRKPRCRTRIFRIAEFTAAGYHSVFSGQKTYNGVALLSRHR